MAAIWDRRTYPYVRHDASAGLPARDVLSSFPGATRLIACGPRGEITSGHFVPEGEAIRGGGSYALVFGATRHLVDSHGEEGKHGRTLSSLPRMRTPRIMVAVDDHRPGRWALRWALRLARRLQSIPELVLFHAVDASLVVAWEGEESGAVEHFAEKARETLDRVVSGMNPRELQGVTLRRHAVVSNPADGIVEASMGYDLVVMGHHGRTGIKHFVLGSTCESVLRHAVVPVFTVRFHPEGKFDPEDAAPPHDISEVMVAVDEAGDFGILYSAAALARMLAARITFVHVVDKNEKPNEHATPEGTADWFATECRSRYPDVTVAADTVTANSDKPADAILRIAEVTGTHAVVIGTRGRGWVERMTVGSVCEKVARKCKLPVIVVGTGKKNPLETSQGLVAFESLYLPLSE